MTIFGSITGDTKPTRPHSISNERYLHLCGLEENWDSYGAAPPTLATRDILLSLAVVPTSDGGLQIEWHCNGWDVEIATAPDGTPSMFWTEKIRSES